MGFNLLLSVKFVLWTKLTFGLDARLSVEKIPGLWLLCSHWLHVLCALGLVWLLKRPRNISSRFGTCLRRSVLRNASRALRLGTCVALVETKKCLPPLWDLLWLLKRPRNVFSRSGTYCGSWRDQEMLRALVWAQFHVDTRDRNIFSTGDGPTNIYSLYSMMASVTLTPVMASQTWELAQSHNLHSGNVSGYWAAPPGPRAAARRASSLAGNGPALNVLESCGFHANSSSFWYRIKLLSEVWTKPIWPENTIIPLGEI